MSMQVAETQGPVLREGARDDCAKQDNRNHVGAWVPALWFPTFGLLFSFFRGYPTPPPFFQNIWNHRVSGKFSA
jgi:hypothetical protein